MPPLKQADREARLPLYLQRLLKQLQEPVPEEQDTTYYELCLLCHASSGQNEFWLTKESLSAEKFQLLIKLKGHGRDFMTKSRFVKNPYEMIPEYVKSASLPPIPWRSALKTAAPSTGVGATLGSTAPSSPTKQSFTALSTGTGAPKLAGGTTTRNPDNVRRLRKIYTLEMAEFEAQVTAYIKSLPVGFQSRREEDGGEYIVEGNIGTEQLSIPAFSFQTNTDLSQIDPPMDEAGVQAWVARLAGKTSSTLLHLCDPLTTAYTFSGVVGTGTKGERSDLCWQPGSDEDSETPTKPLRRLVIEIKTPWTLDPLSFKEFVEQDHLPTADELEATRKDAGHLTGGRRRRSAAKTSFSKVQNIWAQIYDYCVTQGNYFFVLTSYEFWVFGVFSADYTFAQVTDPIPYDSKKPTVLACLMYWTQSAMLVPGLHSIPWGELRRDIQDDIVRTLADNVRLHGCRMEILTSGKGKEKPWATAQRFMKNLGISLDEQEFWGVWDRLLPAASVKMEEQPELGEEKDLDPAYYLLQQALAFPNLVTLTSSTDKEKSVPIKEADPDDVSIFHGSVIDSHGSRYQFPDQVEFKRPLLPIARRRVSSQTNSQPLWPKFDQCFIPPGPVLPEQSPSLATASTPPHAISPAYDFRRRISEPTLHHSFSGPPRNSLQLVIKSEDPAWTEPDHWPGPFNSTAGSLPFTQHQRTLNEEPVEEIGSEIPSIHISTAEHQVISTRAPHVMRQNDGLTHTPTVPTLPTAWTEARGSLSFAPPIHTGDDSPVPQYTGTSSSEAWLQSITSLSTLDVAQNTDSSSEIFQTFSDIFLDVGFVSNSRGVEGFEEEAGQDVETAAHWDFPAELPPLSSDNVHVQQSISPSWFSTPSSASNSVVTPGSESLDLGGYTSEEAVRSTPSKPQPKRSNSGLGLENVVTGDNWIPKKKPRQ